MGFEFSTVFDMMWNHPLLCASVLLLLTPSLFHILIYFSPLLISTALFIVALVSMGPRMEETKEEREKWAKGERPVDLAEDTWPYTDWMSSTAGGSDTAPPVKKRRAEDGPPSWMEVIEEGKSKVAVWIDNMFRAGDEKPLVVGDVGGSGGTTGPSASGSNAAGESESRKVTEVSNISISTSNTSPPGVSISVSDVTDVPPPPPAREDVEVIKTVEVDAPAGKRNAPARASEKELDMPELEIVEVPSAELKASEIAAAEALKETTVSDEPVWDVEADVNNVKAPVTGKEEDLLEVPLNEPVQEVVSHVESDKLTEVVVEEKVAEFPSPVACRSPKLVQSPPAASARDVRSRILKDLQTQLSELEAKRRNKYSQVLSRRMSMKNNNVGKKRDVELS